MNDGNLYLKQIEINYREDWKKAKIYNDLIEIDANGMLQKWNALLYTIILKMWNKIAHSKLIRRGYDIGILGIRKKK